MPSELVKQSADMSLGRHFIIFQRSEGHCVTWLLRAESICADMGKYYVQMTKSAEIHEDGSISVDSGRRSRTMYSHPLECIESELKSYDGLFGCSWEIRELQAYHLQSDFAEVFCSADPDEIKTHIRHCYAKFRLAFPKTLARAFVWYLKTGPMVTFHKRKDKRHQIPIEVLIRFHILWKDYENVMEWHGSYDDILDQMALEYPIP